MEEKNVSKQTIVFIYKLSFISLRNQKIESSYLWVPRRPKDCPEATRVRLLHFYLANLHYLYLLPISFAFPIEVRSTSHSYPSLFCLNLCRHRTDTQERLSHRRLDSDGNLKAIKFNCTSHVLTCSLAPTSTRLTGNTYFLNAYLRTRVKKKIIPDSWLWFIFFVIKSITGLTLLR